MLVLVLRRSSVVVSGPRPPPPSPALTLAPKKGLACAKAAAEMREPHVEDFFTKLIQRTAPKSDAQARGETVVTRRFLENFSGDQVRFLAKSFQAPGDHAGQVSSGHRWPYGPVALITPFNFPLEIPVLQLMGALFMGNKCVAKGDSKNSVVLEQYLRLLHHCGAPVTDCDLINCDGPTMGALLDAAQPRMTLFTGSSKVGEIIAKQLSGRCKLEDAGFDWKILGPDVGDVDYVAHVSDQDAYGYSGQKVRPLPLPLPFPLPLPLRSGVAGGAAATAAAAAAAAAAVALTLAPPQPLQPQCSAQSALFVHENWDKAGILGKLEALAAKRKIDDLTIGPVLTWTTEAILGHVDALLAIPGASVLFGGTPLDPATHSIPEVYGAVAPTAVYVPLEAFDPASEHFELATTEVFGPLQVVTKYDDATVDKVLAACEGMEAHLTAAVVSNDLDFQNKVVGATVNGTTYVGRRARTTGAPQNHWFGPGGDPRGAGIGSAEAIKLVWSCHREVVADTQTLGEGWVTPERT